ncbi:MAG: IdeS/Mac family cysteine endopeptidase [Spirochaetaceae bacterium]|nr:IdeS/Mac family cysteine endopeptidase [Spirochaetaceae bacterium]MBQ8562181.1 IdeS/Mac family cysteine endopeptidase [Spirochaetaceae bacterium]
MIFNLKKCISVSLVVTAALFLCLSCDLNQLPDSLDPATNRQQVEGGSSSDSKNDEVVSPNSGNSAGTTSDSKNSADTPTGTTTTSESTTISGTTTTSGTATTSDSKDSADISTDSAPTSSSTTSSSAVDFSKIDWETPITIKFDPYDGHFVSGGRGSANAEVVETLPGALFSFSTKPWKSGCRFDGWYFDYDTWQRKWNIGTPVYESVQLYARFVESDNPDPNPYDVSSSPATTVTPGYIQHGNGLQYPTALYDMGKVPYTLGEKKTLWAKGVSLEKGWTDNPQYTNNCWGTVSAQMLDWYFRQPGNEGLLSQSTAPKNIDELRYYFFDHRGIESWYINSALDLFFSEFLPDHKNKHVYYGNGNKALSLETLSALCYEHLSRGDVGGIMGVTTGNPHALTLWGADFDENGLVTALYLTTSECTEDEEILKPRINKYERCESPEELGEGHYGWKSSYFVNTAGALLGYTISVAHIYGLHWLPATN